MSAGDTNYFSDSKDVGKARGLGELARPGAADARNLIAQFKKRSGAKCWPHIERARVASGLRTRVDDPNQVDQQTSNLCGVVAMVRLLAFDFPIDYVSFAIDIFERGKGRLRGSKTRAFRMITPSNELKTAAPPPGMNHADWIVAASIRESLNSVFNYTPDEGIFAIKAWNLPGDVEQAFRALGYTRIRAKAGVVSARGFDSLMEASHLYQAGWRVVMLISAGLLDAVPGGIMQFGDHWVGLNSAIVPKIGSGVPMLFPFEVWTWAQRRPVSDHGGPIALKTVIDRFFGFVAGQF